MKLERQQRRERGESSDNQIAPNTASDLEEVITYYFNFIILLNLSLIIIYSIYELKVLNPRLECAIFIYIFIFLVFSIYLLLLKPEEKGKKKVQFAQDVQPPGVIPGVTLLPNVKRIL